MNKLKRGNKNLFKIRTHLYYPLSRIECIVMELRHNRENWEIVSVELRVPIVTRQGVRTVYRLQLTR